MSDLALLAGCVAALLLPIGLVSLNGIAFDLVWLLHITLQVIAALWALRALFSLSLRTDTAGKFFLTICYSFLIVITLKAYLPITSRDALIYHLAVPKLWLQQGKIVELPWNEWSYFPMLLSLAYAGFLKFGLDLLTPIYHFTFLIILSALIARFSLRETKDEFFAAVGAVLTLALPLFMRLATEPMADLGVALYFFMGFAYFIKHLQDDAKSCLWFSGLAFGLALSTKYNSLLAVGLLFPLMLSAYYSEKRSFGNALRNVFIIGIVCSLVISPWLIRNYLWTGNPFTPFLSKLFGEETRNLAFMGVSPLTHRLAIYGDSWWEILAIPVRMLFNGADDDPSSFDGVLSPLLMAALFAPFFAKKAAWQRIAYIYIPAYFVLSIFLFHALVRYQAPMLTLLIALCPVGIAGLKEVLDPASARRIGVIVVVLHLALSGYYLGQLAKRSDLVPFHSAELTAQSYLEKHLAEYRAITFINRDLPPDSLVYLALSGNRYYYFKREVRGSYFSADPLLEALKQEDGGDKLSAYFKKNGITHLLVHKQRLAEVLASSLPADKISNWNEFVKSHLESLYQDKIYWVGKLEY